MRCKPAGHSDPCMAFWVGGGVSQETATSKTARVGQSADSTVRIDEDDRFLSDSAGRVVCVCFSRYMHLAPLLCLFVTVTADGTSFQLNTCTHNKNAWQHCVTCCTKLGEKSAGGKNFRPTMDKNAKCHEISRNAKKCKNAQKGKN